MVPAILILTFAWTLKAMTDSLGAAAYVAGVVEGSAGALQLLLPAIIFVIAGFLAFATGTSWGTFGILIPICIQNNLRYWFTLTVHNPQFYWRCVSYIIIILLILIYFLKFRVIGDKWF